MNPYIGLSELYGKLKRNYSYTRHPASLFRFLRKKGIYVTPEATKPKYEPKPYDTPKAPGEKLQLDVKYVPKGCYKGSDSDEFYQYTIIDEATREHFIYAYSEHSSYSTCDFVLKAIIYFGYIPKCIQTDNGLEFTKHRENASSGPHIFDTLCNKLGIKHKLIKPRTQRHNGKVERSHRNDNTNLDKIMQVLTFNFYRNSPASRWPGFRLQTYLLYLPLSLLRGLVNSSPYNDLF